MGVTPFAPASTSFTVAQPKRPLRLSVRGCSLKLSVSWIFILLNPLRGGVQRVMWELLIRPSARVSFVAAWALIYPKRSAVGRDASQAVTVLSGHATARLPMRTGRGKSPVSIIAYRLDRLRPVAASTAGRLRWCSVISIPFGSVWLLLNVRGKQCWSRYK